MNIESMDIDEGLLTTEQLEEEVNRRSSKRLTPEEIIEQFSEGAPSWMAPACVSGYHDPENETLLNNYKDVVLVTPERVECFHYLAGVSEAAVPVTPLSFGQINFGWDSRTNDPTHSTWLYWRLEDWRIARELVAKMWGLSRWICMTFMIAQISRIRMCANLRHRTLRNTSRQQWPSRVTLTSAERFDQYTVRRRGAPCG